ncbi:voltage-gated chloride channel family protein [Acidicapsa ligni]|uniref:voltage-gated chloride channel family protein n=1 Tax=Acidicapsa ligni TaxID=542300 RepID=UPI0021E0CC1B|nr:voltage-gated chloride channel family protein [Acidicapsa ligni]
MPKIFARLAPLANAGPMRLEQVRVFLSLVRWLLIAAAVGVLAGSASALLLVSLAWATDVRESHKWMIALLPVAGLAVGLLYHYFGKSVERGNNLIIDEIHDPKATLQLRMTPLILLGTVITHLFGGSAGREGTALQTGASLADQLTRPLGLNARDRRILLMAGLSGGFGSVFGVPMAGAIFGIEVLAIGSVGYSALFPCLVASFVGDYATHAWGVQHTAYRVTEIPAMNWIGFLAAIAAGIAFGLVGMLFARLTHTITKWSKQTIRWEPMRPFVGGAIVAAAVFSIGTTKYIGLGIPMIVDSFSQHLPAYDFAAKLLFTAVTLGFGFKGGEVTPLFFIGATLGNALAWILPLPPGLLAGMGFVAVFAGAANTPIASSLMAIELFGVEAGSYAVIACVASYLFSGHAGIYSAQRLGHSKHGWRHGVDSLSTSELDKIRAEATPPNSD